MMGITWSWRAAISHSNLKNVFPVAGSDTCMGPHHHQCSTGLRFPNIASEKGSFLIQGKHFSPSVVMGKGLTETQLHHPTSAG